MLLYLDGGGRSAAFTHGACAALEEYKVKTPETIMANSAANSAVSNG